MVSALCTNNYKNNASESRMLEPPSMRVFAPKIYTFGRFHLDVDRACLLCDRQEIKLRPKSFEVLRHLVENSSRLVAKNELMQAVWRDTFVTDDSLVQCVRDIRRALNDSAQQYIKTVSGRGYIFNLTVTEGDSGKKPPSTEESQVIQNEPTSVQTPAASLTRWYLAGAAVLLISGLAILYPWSKPAPRVWRSVPVTSYPGLEQNPALSPDGNFVAFSWNGESQDNRDIYIQPIRSGSPRRLTTNPMPDVSPAWSPDGRTLAFLRRSNDNRSEVYLIPAVAGSEQKLTEIRGGDFQSEGEFSRAPAWTPDGQRIAVSHRESDDVAAGLFLVSVFNGEKKQLTQPPPGYLGDFKPAFSQDGRFLLFSRHRGQPASEIFMLPLDADFNASGEAKRLTAENRLATNAVFTNDGNRILYRVTSGLPAVSELRSIAVSGASSSEPVPFQDDRIAEFSLRGGRLVYSQFTRGPNVWRVEIDPARSSLSPPRLLIASTHMDYQ